MASIRLDGTLTICPDGRVMAEVETREVLARGEVRGNIEGHDLVRIASSGRAFGEIVIRLISIEEGAEVHVKVNPEREERACFEASIGSKPVSLADARSAPELVRMEA